MTLQWTSCVAEPLLVSCRRQRGCAGGRGARCACTMALIGPTYLAQAQAQASLSAAQQLAFSADLAPGRGRAPLRARPRQRQHPPAAPAARHGR